MHQSEWQNVSYIILVSWEITNFWCRLLLNCSGHVDVVHQEHFWYLIDIFHWWSHCMLIYCRQGTNFHQFRILVQQLGWYLPHTLHWHFFWRERFFGFIGDSLRLQYLLWWVMIKHDSSRWDIIPFLGGYSHHETACCIFNMYQFFCSPPSESLFPDFSWFVFLNASASYLSFVCIYHSLFPT